MDEKGHNATSPVFGVGRSSIDCSMVFRAYTDVDKKVAQYLRPLEKEEVLSFLGKTVPARISYNVEDRLHFVKSSLLSMSRFLSTARVVNSDSALEGICKDVEKAIENVKLAQRSCQQFIETNKTDKRLLDDLLSHCYCVLGQLLFITHYNVPFKDAFRFLSDSTIAISEAISLIQNSRSYVVKNESKTASPNAVRCVRRAVDAIGCCATFMRMQEQPSDPKVKYVRDTILSYIRMGLLLSHYIVSDNTPLQYRRCASRCVAYYMREAQKLLNYNSSNGTKFFHCENTMYLQLFIALASYEEMSELKPRVSSIDAEDFLYTRENLVEAYGYAEALVELVRWYSKADERNEKFVACIKSVSYALGDVLGALPLELSRDRTSARGEWKVLCPNIFSQISHLKEGKLRDVQRRLKEVVGLDLTQHHEVCIVLEKISALVQRTIDRVDPNRDILARHWDSPTAVLPVFYCELPRSRTPDGRVANSYGRRDEQQTHRQPPITYKNGVLHCLWSFLSRIWFGIVNMCSKFSRWISSVLHCFGHIICCRFSNASDDTIPSYQGTVGPDVEQMLGQCAGENTSCITRRSTTGQQAEGDYMSVAVFANPIARMQETSEATSPHDPDSSQRHAQQDSVTGACEEKERADESTPCDTPSVISSDSVATQHKVRGGVLPVMTGKTRQEKVGTDVVHPSLQKHSVKKSVSP